MAQVIKVTTTKPLPPGAETVAKGGKQFFQIKRAGKTIYCELTQCKTKYRIESRKWYAQYRDATGRIKRKPAFTDKGASLKLAQELEERAMRRKMGLPGSAESIFEEPVDGLLDRFEKFLRSKNNTVYHCDQTMNRIKRLFEGAKVRSWGQINPTTVLSWLATERERDAIGIKTSNYYLVAVKEFCNWAVDDGIVAENPLRSAKAMNAEGDVRRKRRAIGADEFQRLIAAARMSGPVQGMDGQERAILYIVAAWTGFRRGELASLRLSQIVLDGDSPAITVSAAYSKRRREDSIPLHPVVVEELKAWLAPKKLGNQDVVFALASSNGYLRYTSKMMAADLKTARAAWIAEAANDNEREEREKSSFLRYQSDAVVYADFHANRHTFITNLVKVGIQPKLAQSLARHSDIRLTFNIYSHVEKGEQTDAIGKLHSPRTTQNGPAGKAIDSEREPKPKNKGKPESPSETHETAQRAESDAGDLERKETKDAKTFALQFAQTIRGGGHLEAGGGNDTPEGVVSGPLPQTLDLSGFSGDCQQMADKNESSPGWARTTDTRINSPVLFAILRGKTQCMRKRGLQSGA